MGTGRPRPRFRAVCAWVFLLVMVVNGGFELGLVLRVHPLPAGIGIALASSADQHAGHEEKGGGSCCHAPKKPEPAACSCSCCGPVCSMGDSCTCGKPAARPPAGGMFFTAPSCHPEQEAAGASDYTPPSLRFVFVLSTLPAPPVQPALFACLLSADDRCVDLQLPPPVPPPKRVPAAALSAA